MGKWGKKEEIFTVSRGKNIIFGNRGVAKISYFGQIFSTAYSHTCLVFSDIEPRILDMLTISEGLSFPDSASSGSSA